MDEHDDVRVLLDGAGVAQVGQRGTLVVARRRCTGELRAGNQRHFQLQRNRLQLAADFAHLQLTVLGLAVGVHKTQIVHDDEVKPLVHHQAAAARTELRWRDARRIVNVNRGVRHGADGFRQLYPVLFTQGALADALHVDARVGAEHTQGNLLARHFQREHGDAFVRVECGVGSDVHREGRFAHGRARADDDEFAAVQTGEHVVQQGEAGRHAGDAPLELRQLLDVGVGVVQHVADVDEALAGCAVHHDVENRLFRVSERLLQGILLAVTLLRNLLRRLDELAQCRFFGHQGDVRLDVRGRRHEAHQPHEVLRAADAFQRPAAGQLRIDGHEVNWALLMVQGNHRLEDFAVRRLIEIVGGQGFHCLQHRVFILHHRAQHGLLRFDAIGRRHATKF